MPSLPKYSSPELLARLRGLGLRARRVVEGPLAGQHRSPHHGFAVEFAEHRPYAPGDDLRRLDWRVLARSDREYVRQYEQETNLRATLVVDASASMAYGAPDRKFDLAAGLAAALAQILLEQQDAVGLALADSRRRQWLPHSSAPSQAGEIVRLLEQAELAGTTDLGAVLRTVAEQTPKRGLVLVFSDLLTDLETFADGLSRLRHRGHETVVLQVLHADEMTLPFDDLVQFRDLEGTEELFADPWGFRKAYQAAMRAFVAEAAELCARRAVDHLLVRSDDDLAAALSRYLHERDAARG